MSFLQYILERMWRTLSRKIYMESSAVGTAMKKTVLMGLIVAAIGAAMIVSLGTSNLAFSQIAPNLAGQEASQLAQCQTDCLGEPDTNKGGMGQHSASVTGGGSALGGLKQEPRVGLGNVGEDILGSSEKLTPSEVIAQLCPDPSSCP
jgi:hypothetical protein